MSSMGGLQLESQSWCLAQQCLKRSKVRCLNRPLHILLPLRQQEWKNVCSRSKWGFLPLSLEAEYKAVLRVSSVICVCV